MYSSIKWHNLIPLRNIFFDEIYDFTLEMKIDQAAYFLVPCCLGGHEPLAPMFKLLDCPGWPGVIVTKLFLFYVAATASWKPCSGKHLWPSLIFVGKGHIWGSTWVVLSLEDYYSFIKLLWV